MAGHKTKTNSLTGNLPELDAAGVDQRWERVWYFNSVDAGSNLSTNISFDFSKAGLSSNISADPNLYKLLTRNGQGNWTVVSEPASVVNGDRVVFSDVNIIDGNQYTLGMLDSGDGTFPVELLSFSAKKNGEKTGIQWETASEQNNDYFLVQRATENLDYQTIAKIQGSGHSNQIQTYSFTDENPVSGVNYYRLKQVDFDGGFEIFGPRAVKHKQKIRAGLSHLGNQLQIALSGDMTANGRVEIYSLSGKQMYSTGFSQSKINIPTANLSNAIYLVRIRVEDQVIQEKVYLD
jgi:hypothetical protein